ncbi:nuclear pore complex protein Nup75 [Condylostylus longicornis]|uniref:nuclear pore complex protein Nup75 n=1 Tax=Condylostylus longicornis TaxID=2530218 RepID=UPI00244DF6E9|nr:nuclear pore complex protein Nup75 [Condylostylus longicornis]
MQEEESAATFNVIDDLMRKSGIVGRWINSNKLSVCGYKHIFASSIDKPSEFANLEPVNIFHLQPEFIYEDSILRSLVAEANSIFLAAHEIKNPQKNDYIKISRTYRCVIRACLEKLNEELQIETDDKNKTKLQNFVTIFYSIECVWHLCEILFIESSTSNIVVPQLLEWIRFHFPTYERQATDLLLQGHESGNQDNYWQTIKGLILQGQVDVARAILKLNTSYSTSSFTVAEQILKSMPKFNAGGLSVQKFKSQWQYWLTDTELKLSSGCMSAEPELEEIIRIVIGHTETWDEIINSSKYWYEFLPGFLFYTEPACKYFELGTLANCWLNRYANVRNCSETGFLKQLDHVILNVMENDIINIIFAIQKIGDNLWFATHLTDLLYLSGQLQINGENQENDGKKLRDSFLFEFGSALMGRESLWMLGIDYLKHCNAEERNIIKLLLLKVPNRNEYQAMKVINTAKKLKILEYIEPEVSKVQARKSIELNRYGNALEWAIRSKDSVFITSIADHFLNHYSNTGDMLCPDVVANVGAKMFVSPRLVFLVKYFEFHQHYQRKEFIQAAELLVNLLDSQITPEYFWPTLLFDAVPLLESKDPKIPSRETCIILQHLETNLIPLIEKRRHLENPKIFKDYRIENIEEIVKLLRLACARNLARALVIENTVIV